MAGITRAYRCQTGQPKNVLSQILIARLPVAELESILEEIVAEAGLSDRMAIRLLKRMIATHRDLIADRKRLRNPQI